MRSDFAWAPGGWDDYPTWYPETPSLPPSTNACFAEFSSIWERHRTAGADARWPMQGVGKKLFVLVRGIFGNLMPGNFVPVLDHFEARGLTVIRPRTYVVGTIAKSAALLRDEVRPFLDRSDGVVWLCQSRGGLDVLRALTRYTELRDATAGVALVQTPAAASAVMESVLDGSHRKSIRRRRTLLLEGAQKLVFSLPAFRGGCRELTTPGIDQAVADLRGFDFDFPIVAVATWSIEPTSWVDSYHRRLEEIRPGCAHDGQFYLEDQLWPAAEQLVLGRVDHAQSVMGGKGFDPASFWAALAEMVLVRSGCSATRSSRLRTRIPSGA